VNQIAATASAQTSRSESRTASANGSCRFAARCPSAMPKCWELHPPLFQSDAHRVVACYLHEGAPTADSTAMDEVFVRA
jgi:ABC-type dipeptide/oligopeptide/nickel transport system ATPase component